MSKQALLPTTYHSREFPWLAAQGKTTWWRYILGIILVLFLWLIVGSLPIAIVTLLGLQKDQLLYYLALSFSFACLAGAVLFVTAFIHQRDIRTLITPYRSVHWRTIFYGAGVWTVITLGIAVLDAILHPNSYQFTFVLKDWLPFVLFAVILTPVQTTAEELLFRGYLLQLVHWIVRNRWITLSVITILFGVGHFFNPEMDAGFWLTGATYLILSLFLTAITILDNRLELALGIHAANNLFSLAIANYAGSALPTPSIWTATIIDPVFNLLALIIGASAFLLIAFHPTLRAKVLDSGRMIHNPRQSAPGERDLVVYHWVEGSVPPPHHYEYSIRLFGSTAVIALTPDYPGEAVPQFIHEVQFEADAAANLWQAISNLPLHQLAEDRSGQPNLGGSQQWIEGTLNGKGFQTPARMRSEDLLLAGKVFEQIKRSIPSEIWSRLEAERTNYHASQGDANR